MIVRCDNFSLFTFRYFRRGSGNRRTAGEAGALGDAKLPEPQSKARSLAEPCPGQPPADSFWIPSFTVLRFLLDLFTCCYGSFGVFLAHSPAFEVGCNKQRSG